MNLVETFIDGERAKCSWLDRLFNNYPVFYLAKDITSNLKYQDIDKSFIVRPSISRRLLATLLICLGMFGWFSILLLVIQKILLPISIAFILFISVWTGSILWTFFLNPKLSYKIIIDKNKIILGRQTFEWNKVCEYLLMQKGSGRYLETMLIIFVDNKEVLKFNLTNLNKSGQEIIKRIEFYKK